MTRDQALAALRKVHKYYIHACGQRFAHIPFRARAVPGWIYLPVFDCVAWEGDLQ